MGLSRLADLGNLGRNVKPAIILMVLPIAFGLTSIVLALSTPLRLTLTQRSSERLVTENWQPLYDSLLKNQPVYERKNSYHLLREGQNLTWAARHFGVAQDLLQQLNPGTVVYGTTIVVPPVGRPLEPIAQPSGNLALLKIQEKDGVLHLDNNFTNPLVSTDIPELAVFLASYRAINKIGEKQFRLERSISLDNNIRLDITNSSVERLELRSQPNFETVCLCLENAELLIKDTLITSHDPTTNLPDQKYTDGRSFIRALKSSRMDVIGSTITYLGRGLFETSKRLPIMNDGGTYGISWRIPDNSLGRELVTGWVESSRFTKNHFGGYTFGASGMTWRDNRFTENDVYGLDPHDDSNSALIEGNAFLNNGKHGFIVSKRCNYNIIRRNVSRGNKLHGFMLHQDSTFNLIEDNVAEGNSDNFVIYASSFNTVARNQSLNPRASHVRINENSTYNFIRGNSLSGGRQGIFVYGNSIGTLVAENSFNRVKEIVSTYKAKTTVIAHNRSDKLGYSFALGDRVIFGPNTISKPATLAKE